MRKYLLAFVLLIISTFSIADESVCDIHKESFTPAEKTACGLSMLDGSDFTVLLRDSVKQEYWETAFAIADSKLDTELSGVNVKTQRTPLSELIDGIFAAHGILIGWILIAIAIIGYLIINGNGMMKGVFITKKSGYFLLIMLMLSALAFSGHIFGIGAIIKVFSAMLGVALFVYHLLPEFKEMADDVKIEQVGFSMRAEEFASETVDKQIQANIQDIIARRIFLSVNPARMSLKYEVGDDKFFTCVANAETPKFSLKRYTQADFEISQKCAFKELGYKEYSIARIVDDKTTNESEGVIGEIQASSTKYRQLAFDMINNVCAGIYNEIEDRGTNYANVCVDTDMYGIPNLTDGLVGTVTSSVYTNEDQLIKERAALVDRLAAVSVKDMLKNATTVQKAVVENVQAGNLLSGFNAGEDYRRAYKAAGESVLEFKVINDVIIKKSSLKQFLSIEDNIDIWGGGTIDTFGLPDYYNKFTDKPSVKKFVLETVNMLTGNAGQAIGMDYRDCQLKGNCNSGSKNLIKPLIDSSNRTLMALGVINIGSKVGFKYYSQKAKDSTDPLERMYNKAQAQKYLTVDTKTSFLIIAMIVVFVILINSLFSNYVRVLLETLVFYTLLPVLIPYVIIFALVHVFSKDDNKSFNEMLKAYGFYDFLLRLPLVVIGWITGLLCLKILMPLAAWNLNLLLGSSFAIDAMGDLGFSLFYVFLYTACFMISFAVAASVTFKGVREGIERVSYKGMTYSEHAMEGFNNEVSSMIQKAVRR
ncbi:hypothetical protein E6W26_28990 [Pseudomonas aeruginosa]|uniref:hypothetical protein n=1 Tax=Pseudomonas aeruginosa TaxID=287 RepID=UPI00109D8BC1|nr:hypothetical protein [Pseudomonas aeruginosa]EKV1241290.1 hypothetical protein [Pseudomonas aeruginosa]EKV8586199.1 hypothetical protein [Pseudomonas aeruginosa]ELN5407417.1 hypothetical protein [Pseudomonas aeruginosa]ELP1438608.1 hypothetical protein [Pseudomonas aeruginosa]THB16435.1 hypothetical protein E6W26_28990 [Pseudomonas aeruginosa]